MLTTRTPIGFVTKGDSSRIELLGVDRWKVTVDGRDAPHTALNLATLYAPEHGDRDPPAYGRCVLADLARRIGGRAVYPDSEGSSRPLAGPASSPAASPLRG